MMPQPSGRNAEMEHVTSLNLRPAGISNGEIQTKDMRLVVKRMVHMKRDIRVALCCVGKPIHSSPAFSSHPWCIPVTIQIPETPSDQGQSTRPGDLQDTGVGK